MTDPIIPAAEKVAAKRAFIRTTYQAYAATLATGLPSAAAIIALIQDPTGWLLAGITVGLATVSPLIAGAAAYASIRGSGIPQAYTDATLVQQAAVTPLEAHADQNAAVSRVLRHDLNNN